MHSCLWNVVVKEKVADVRGKYIVSKKYLIKPNQKLMSIDQ